MFRFFDIYDPNQMKICNFAENLVYRKLTE